MSATKLDAAQRFNAAAKRARKRPAEAPSPHDTGPIILAQTIVGHDGAVIREALVIKEPRADPDRPNTTVTAARRRDALRTMFNNGSLSGPQWYAAVRFRDDLDLAQGVRLEAGDTNFVYGARSGAGGDPTQVQLDAVRRVKGAWRAAGLGSADVLVFVVINLGSVEGFATHQRIGTAKARKTLLDGLTRIDEYYQTVKVYN